MFERYVAIGDSTTEGLDDRDGRGGYRGWADRLAERLSALGPLRYANLAVRGRLTREIRDQQLGAAVAMRPDLATAVAGVNDLLRPRFDLNAYRADMEALFTALIDVGATVLTFTMPDLSPVMPLARPLRARLRAMNQALQQAAARTGAVAVDFAAHRVASDPRLWSDDRLHANAQGHARVAAALAEALHLPGADATWQAPLPTACPRTLGAALNAELSWTRMYLLPWLAGHLHTSPLADARQPKRPALLPFGDPLSRARCPTRP